MRDSQLTELSGRQFLIAQLVAGGLEVAIPVRDRAGDRCRKAVQYGVMPYKIIQNVDQLPQLLQFPDVSGR